MFNKDNKREISAVENLLAAKVYVTPKRLEELTALAETAWNALDGNDAPPLKLLCVNVDKDLEHTLQKLLGPEHTLLAETITDDKADKKKLCKLFGSKWLDETGIAAVVLELPEDDVRLLDKRMYALSILRKLPIVGITRRGPAVIAPATACTGNTWPVFQVNDSMSDEEVKPIIHFFLYQLPRVQALSAAIKADIQDRVAYLGDVNPALHFAKRASVALIPFGVLAVNMLGIMRLMATILADTGMRGDKSSSKAIALLGAQNAALVNALDSMGDLYGFAVFTTVLADLQGQGLMEAVEAIELVDGLMLGSISVVTGAISAVGAYVTRPQVVAAAAEFLASLQLIYYINPEMRRATEKQEPKTKEQKEAAKKAKMFEKEAAKREKLRQKEAAKHAKLVQKAAAKEEKVQQKAAKAEAKRAATEAKKNKGRAPADGLAEALVDSDPNPGPASATSSGDDVADREASTAAAASDADASAAGASGSAVVVAEGNDDATRLQRSAESAAAGADGSDAASTGSSSTEEEGDGAGAAHYTGSQQERLELLMRDWEATCVVAPQVAASPPA